MHKEENCWNNPKNKAMKPNAKLQKNKKNKNKQPNFCLVSVDNLKSKGRSKAPIGVTAKLA